MVLNVHWFTEIPLVEREVPVVIGASFIHTLNNDVNDDDIFENVIEVKESYLCLGALDSHRSSYNRMLNNAYRREAHNLPQSCHIFGLLLLYLLS